MTRRPGALALKPRLMQAATLAAALTLSTAALVAAHVELVSSAPEFDGELDSTASAFTVTDAGGHEVGTGSVDLTVADRKVMIGEVSITQPGIYTVEYRVLGVDGHEVEGNISFAYATDVEIPAGGGQQDEHEQPDTALPTAGDGPLTLLGAGLLLAAWLLTIRRRALR